MKTTTTISLTAKGLKPLDTSLQRKSTQKSPLPAQGECFVAIEGPIGVGKTSLTRLLSQRWQCQAHFEHFEDNPFLTRGFYEDRKALGFNTEIFFLLSRFKQQETFRHLTGTHLVDYLFEKNRIFSELNLQGVDRRIYDLTYDNFIEHIRKPDLVVLLEADLESLMRRIYTRDREFERNLCPSYLEKLNQAYFRFFAEYDKAPVLRISTSELDFVRDQQDFESIAERVEERLKGQVQLSLANSEQVSYAKALNS